MTVTSDQEDTPLLDAARVMLDPTRLEILAVIRSRTHLCEDLDDFTGIHVSDIIEATGLAQPLVSKHLARLRSAGLVVPRRRGQWIYYLRDEPRIESVKEFVASL